MVVWNRPRGIRSQGCFFVSSRWGKSKKRVLNGIGRRSLFALLGKAHSKWWYETDLLEFDPKGVFSFRPDGESRKNSSWAKLDDVRQPGFLPCLERPTQNGGMKPTSWNSIPRVFFRFASKGKVEKTRFERNWTTFVNPAFCTAWKSPLKMVVWNRTLGIRSQGCFFFSPRWGKSKKRVSSAVGRRSSTRLLALLGIAHSKWWYETDLVEFDPKGVFSFRPDGESRKSASCTQLDDVRQPGFLPCLEKPTQNGGMKPTWSKFFRMGKVEKNAWYWMTKPTSWNSIRPGKGVFSFRPDGESRKFDPNAFRPESRKIGRIGRRSSTRLFALLGKAHSKWWYETDLVEFDPKGNVVSISPRWVFWTQLDDVVSPRWEKSKKTRFERNWMTFPGFLPCPAFCPASKSPLKMVVWNRRNSQFFRSQFWTFFRFCPAWKSPLKMKMVVWNRPRGIRSQGCFFVSPRWGKSKKRVFNVIGRRSSTRLFALLGKGGNRSQGCFFGKKKTRFERNWATFVNPAFCPAWKSPLKMVVWNRPRGIRSQGCFFVSPRWGKSKKSVLNAIGRRSFLPCLEKPTWWYETDLVEIVNRFFLSPRWGNSKKTRFEHNWMTFLNPAFCPFEKPTQNAWYENVVEFDQKGVFSFRPETKKRPFVEIDPKGVFSFRPLENGVWNRPRGIRSQRVLNVQLDDVP